MLRQRPYRSRASWGRSVAPKTQLATVSVLCYHSNRATWYAAVASTSRGGWGRVLGCVLTMLGIKADTFGSAFGVSSPVSHPSTDRIQLPATCVHFRTYCILGLRFEIGKYRPSAAYDRLVKFAGARPSQKTQKGMPLFCGIPRRISSRT